ncbi:kinase-like domain-containing protein [Gigaspora rosea]|uniref:Kinase-like domain-containing protein n=1 Tax=Gigaspora rosea TaxID=44941 RepID=A0A397VCV4_9GLOM|nr:kinase-like domain-containing protein [Gigaspora rosea]
MDKCVCLKSLNGSKEDIKGEFLNEVENQHKHGGKSAIAIYGITKNPDDGSLRKLLDSKYNDLSWEHKIKNLKYIADGLAAIHKANLVHKDFHSGNIVNDNMVSSLITDFGLCRPVVLYGEKFTEKSDIYSFGIIMSEVFTGYPPYHDIPHDFSLATQICQGRRPKIRCKVPQLLLNLMNECLDAEPQRRPTAKTLVDMLEKFDEDLNYTKAELYKQVEEIKSSGKNSSIHEQVNQTKSTRFNYQTHKQAIYTSRSLNFQKLPKPVNAAISHSIELDEVPDI